MRSESNTEISSDIKPINEIPLEFMSYLLRGHCYLLVLLNFAYLFQSVWFGLIVTKLVDRGFELDLVFHFNSLFKGLFVVTVHICETALSTLHPKNTLGNRIFGRQKAYLKGTRMEKNPFEKKNGEHSGNVPNAFTSRMENLPRTFRMHSLYTCTYKPFFRLIHLTNPS